MTSRTQADRDALLAGARELDKVVVLLDGPTPDQALARELCARGAAIFRSQAEPDAGAPTAEERKIISYCHELLPYVARGLMHVVKDAEGDS